MDDLEEFLAGERPDDVAIYLADEAVDDPETLAQYGHATGDGLLLVLDGETGRSVFRTATGTAPMGFAKRASGRSGDVRADLTGGDCPDGPGGSDEHRARFLLAFVQPRTEGVEGYEEGDVVHAYVQCECGTAYSERWVAGEVPGGSPVDG